MESDLALVAGQKAFFAKGSTLSIDFRLTQLKKLRTLIEQHETEIAAALFADLHKSPPEACMTEIYVVLQAIDEAINRLKHWMKPTAVPTPFILQPGKSLIEKSPYGCVLIMAPWNYPFMLLMSPLIGAMSAGNCVVLKPSELAPHTETLIEQLINHCFPKQYLAVIRKEASHVQSLFEIKWDYIFFTGSTKVGQIIMTSAARYLTPMTLELGGKTPCIVDKTADLTYAARRIIWAKMLNAGQSCIAPDYLCVHVEVKELLIKKMRVILKRFFESDAFTSPYYGRIINHKQLNRLKKMLEAGHILYGGNMDEKSLYCSPTLIDQVNWEDPIMQEEIFGPLLPIFTFNVLDDAIERIKHLPSPLAIYLFTREKAQEKKVASSLPCGGLCINDCMMQFANWHLPFGGVGSSGMGRYRGVHSFEIFSNKKSIYKRNLLIDIPLMYPPYSQIKLNMIKLLLRPWRFLRSLFR